MAKFIVEFAEKIPTPPSYTSFSKEENVLCHTDVIFRDVVFDSVGNYVLGVDYTGDFPAEIVRIESFTDQLFYSDVGGGGNYHEETGYTPSEMIDNSTGLPLTYPYTMNINDISNLDFTVGEGEMPCKIEEVDYQRLRIITYVIFDSQGNAGTVENSKLVTNAYM